MKIALAGFGDVGQGLVEVIPSSSLDIEIVIVADSSSILVDQDGLEAEDLLKKKKQNEEIGEKENLEDMLKQVEYDVLIEATPTTLSSEPALTYMKTAIKEKSHVVTSNKGPVANYYTELKELADENNVQIKLEATVGGAIPVIKTLQNFAENIKRVNGVLNGTCNFILTRMLDEELSYQHVLGEAQDMGIAESDPSFDVQGVDTAFKCAIISNVLGEPRQLDDIDTQGITEISTEALRLARRSNHTIKLVGEVDKNQAKVAPRLVSNESSLNVRGTLNVVSIETELAGKITLKGHGAGRKETASAILSDINSVWR